MRISSHRFLNGLSDQKVQQEVEFVKEQVNIDEVLDEIVRYQGSHQSGQPIVAKPGLLM